MTNVITNWVAGIFGEHIWLATIVVSMLPLAELKVGIPFAMARGYSFWKALLFGMMGSVILVPLLALFFTPIVNWLKKSKMFKKMGHSIQNRIDKKSQKLSDGLAIKQESQEEILKKKRTYMRKFFAIMLFVAVPIPLTGVWTGTCIAVAIGLGFWGTFSSVLLGNLIAGTVVSILSALIGEELMFIIMLSLVALLILCLIARAIIKKIKQKNQSKD